MTVAEGAEDLAALERAARRRPPPAATTGCRAGCSRPLEAAATRLLMPRPDHRRAGPPRRRPSRPSRPSPSPRIRSAPAWRWSLLASFVEGVAERLACCACGDETRRAGGRHILPCSRPAPCSRSARRCRPCAAGAASRSPSPPRLPGRAADRDGRRGAAPARAGSPSIRASPGCSCPSPCSGLWGTGLGALAIYAAGDFFWVQRQVHAPAPPCGAAQTD